jgi:hypothetical protein
VVPVVSEVEVVGGLKKFEIAPTMLATPHQIKAMSETKTTSAMMRRRR